MMGIYENSKLTVYEFAVNKRTVIYEFQNWMIVFLFPLMSELASDTFLDEGSMIYAL